MERDTGLKQYGQLCLTQGQVLVGASRGFAMKAPAQSGRGWSRASSSPEEMRASLVFTEHPWTVLPYVHLTKSAGEDLVSAFNFLRRAFPPWHFHGHGPSIWWRWRTTAWAEKIGFSPHGRPTRWILLTPRQISEGMAGVRSRTALPQSNELKSSSPVSQNRTATGNRIFTEMSKLIRSL